MRRNKKRRDEKQTGDEIIRREGQDEMWLHEMRQEKKNEDEMRQNLTRIMVVVFRFRCLTSIS